MRRLLVACLLVAGCSWATTSTQPPRAAPTRAATLPPTNPPRLATTEPSAAAPGRTATPTPTPTPNTNPLIITGRITDATGAPVTDATIESWTAQGSMLTAPTGADGTYSLYMRAFAIPPNLPAMPIGERGPGGEPLPFGRYCLYIETSTVGTLGLGPSGWTIKYDQNCITVGTTIFVIDATLPAGTPVSGNVLRTIGRVAAYDSCYDVASDTELFTEFGTDASGHFSIRLVPGTYSIQCGGGETTTIKVGASPVTGLQLGSDDRYLMVRRGLWAD